MIIPAPKDIAFSIFNIPIYWYGIIMAFAILVSILVANKLYTKINQPNHKDLIIEYAPLIIVLGIFCARIYFCCLNPEYYFSHPIEILDIREGGLSIHGGIIGGIIAVYIMSKRSKTSFISLIDAVACSTILGQAIGRWGNYFNSEAYGYPTSMQNWGLYIPVERRINQYSNYELFHPTFLYESILDLISFIILCFIYKKCAAKYKGVTLFAYLTIYAIIRYFIEKIRIDSALNIGSLPIAELVSFILLAIGIIGIIFVIIKNKNVKKY